MSAPTPRSAPTQRKLHTCHLAVPLFPAAAPTPTRVATSLSLSHAAAPPPHGSPPGIRTPHPTPPASVPGPNTGSEFKAGEFRSSVKAGAVFMNEHSKFLGALFTAGAVLTVVVGSATHLKDEVRRVEHEAKTAVNHEAALRETAVEHEAALREANEAKAAAQSDAANLKSVADMYRVLTGAEHKDVVKMTKKKYIPATPFWSALF